MSPSCLESQGCRFDSTFLNIYIIYMLLFFCLLCSRCFCLILFCILLSSFSLHLHFPKVRLFCVAFVFDCFLERLGYEYFSWWYMQHMLPYGAGIISLYAFIQYLLFAVVLVNSFFLFLFKRSMVPASPNVICHFFTRAVPKGLTFRLCFTCVKCACFVLYSSLSKLCKI